MKISIPEKFKKEYFSKNQSLIIIVAVILGLLLFGSEFLVKEKPKHETFSADTIIPKGFVLIPIELANFQSTSALIGQYGIVDLYITSQGGSRRIATQVKIIRAPLNANLFAVLVPETESAEVLKAGGPLTAVVQNPDQKEPTTIDKKIVKRSRIQYQEGGHQ